MAIAGERTPAASWHAELLPSFDGARVDLELSRDAPAHFAVRPVTPGVGFRVAVVSDMHGNLTALERW